jgi:hypothetical protein
LILLRYYIYDYIYATIEKLVICKVTVSNWFCLLRNSLEMKKEFIKYISIFLTVVFTGIAIPITGCTNDLEQFQGVSSESDFSVSQVPDTDLDVYVYAKQRNPTTIPADLLNMSHDIKVESLAIWGVPDEKDMAFGMGLIFDDEETAKEIHDLIKDDPNLWKWIRGNNLYVVQGTGVSADSLKTAIQNNNFKLYNNAKLLDAANMLPKSVRAKLIAIAMMEPSSQLMEFISTNIGSGTVEEMNEVLKLADLQLVIAGLYSPHQINISRAMEVVQGDGNLSKLDVGLLVAVKSGLPGFLVEPRVKEILIEQGLEEVQTEEFTLYKGMWSNPYADDIPVVARIEGNYVFITISGQMAYAETLITSIYK